MIVGYGYYYNKKTIEVLVNCIERAIEPSLVAGRHERSRDIDSSNQLIVSHHALVEPMQKQFLVYANEQAQASLLFPLLFSLHDVL